ncbi:MMPL family transporter [uncultured Clostridium sp.]|uniref:efflux RND transporter permease subunit n=1 Tax=uncultured Clostridium sp. TaxID=59620 RepID=UPI002639B70F|nr:MMPL family transporter [uncultured Clostridium sp.]
MQNFILVNYDMNDYLPDETESIISLQIMEQEFSGNIPNVRASVSNVTLLEGMEIKNKIKEIEHVEEVIWVDDLVDINIPVEFLSQDLIKEYYKDNNALYSITISEENNIETINKIKEITGNENAIAGSAVDMAVATESTTKEITKIILIAVPFTLLILILTTTSWFEPIVILISIGIAIIINAGTNLIFGEISFVTNAAGSILQLAVSLDYSVFLLHRYKEIKENINDPKEAMHMALCKSMSSILSSGVTTVIGFLALAVMKFKIGPDLGVALAKGIGLSLITVFIFTPGLILYCSKLIQKTEHKNFMPSFNGLGKMVKKLMIPMVIIFIIAIIPSYLASTNNTYYYGASKIFGEETKLGEDTKFIEEKFGKLNNYVMMVPKGDLKKELDLSKELKKIKEVGEIISYVNKVGIEIPVQYLDKELTSNLISNNYSRMIINVKTDFEGEEAFEVVEKIREVAKKYYGNEYELVGETVSTYDLKNTITEDMISVNFLAIGAVFLVLMITMKSLYIPMILVLAIETAIWINLSLNYYMAIPLFYIGYLIISSIQLGATVDYAILMTERYLEFRKKGSKDEAIVKSVSTVMISILTSGSIMIGVGFSLGYISSHKILSQLGVLLGKGTICSLIIVVFVLPGMLYLCDNLILKKKRGKKNENK